MLTDESYHQPGGGARGACWLHWVPQGHADYGLKLPYVGARRPEARRSIAMPSYHFGFNDRVANIFLRPVCKFLESAEKKFCA